MDFEKQRNDLISICGNLLDEGKASVIIGFTGGIAGQGSIPSFFRKKEDLDGLKWDNTCSPNLAKYLLEKKEGAAIIAKPCDARAIVMYMAENQLQRSKVYIIGMECPGMSDKEGNPAPGCRECTRRTPPAYDVLVSGAAGPAAEVISAQTKAVPEKKGTSFDDKLRRFQEEMKKCILCYTCRQACYGCYCETCFIDRDNPGWLPADLDMGRKMLFHLGRAMHLAGRCVECGACERSCPSGVNIRYLVSELADFCEELYGFVPGMNENETPAMMSYDQNDREVGFLGGEEHDQCCGKKE